MDIAAHLVLRTKTVVVTDFAMVGRRHIDTGLSLRNISTAPNYSCLLWTARYPKWIAVGAVLAVR